MLEEGLGEPVEGAVVRVVGHEASPQITDATGRFVTYDLPEGEVVLEISHSDYLSAQCPASVPSELDCLLVPAVVGGQLRLRTVDAEGDPGSDA